MVVPYTFRKAHFKDDKIKGYWISLYCFYDGTSVYMFHHQSEMLENACFAQECGVEVTTFIKDILVTETHFSGIFHEIEDYVSCPSDD